MNLKIVYKQHQWIKNQRLNMSLHFILNIIHSFDFVDFNQCNSSTINYSTFLFEVLGIGLCILFYSLVINPFNLILSLIFITFQSWKNVILTGFLTSTFVLVSCFLSINHKDIHLHLNSSHIFGFFFSTSSYFCVTM